MKTVYFVTGGGQWRYDMEDDDYQLIVKDILDKDPDLEEMLDESLEILRDLSEMGDEEMDEEDELDQTIAAAFIWHYFNTLPEEKGRIDGDVAVIEDEDGEGVSIAAAADVLEED